MERDFCWFELLTEAQERELHEQEKVTKCWYCGEPAAQGEFVIEETIGGRTKSVDACGFCYRDEMAARTDNAYECGCAYAGDFADASGCDVHGRAA